MRRGVDMHGHVLMFECWLGQIQTLAQAQPSLSMGQHAEACSLPHHFKCSMLASPERLARSGSAVPYMLGSSGLYVEVICAEFAGGGRNGHQPTRQCNERATVAVQQAHIGECLRDSTQVHYA